MIAQCNNALVFPGLGTGCIAANIQNINNEILWQVCQVICEHGCQQFQEDGSILPGITKIRALSMEIAHRIAPDKKEIIERICTI